MRHGAGVGKGQRERARALEAGGVRGKIALVRYGRCYRGIKVDLAARNGCAAVLLFSESSSDGAAKGPTWPAGPWKPGWDAQRGSILPIEHVPGDPTTPGCRFTQSRGSATASSLSSVGPPPTAARPTCLAMASCTVSLASSAATISATATYASTAPVSPSATKRW